MQNVSNLTIPEGQVRTVHDKNNRLLWGKVNYDTKYKGDTFQQTYSGKNLFDGLFTQGTYFNSGATNRIITSQSPKLTAGQTYTLSFTGLPTNFRFAVNLSSTPIRAGEGGPLTYDSGWKTTTFSFSPQGDYYFAIVMSKISGADIVPDEVADMKWQLELGSTATSFEPYVGGMPAPNPDYPQDIQVVTGTQTITLSDGVNNHDYTVNLGTVELCKIGAYQDYLYKSGDDWYVHKETGKVILDGTNVTWFATANGFMITYNSQSPFYNVLAVGEPSYKSVCNYFTFNPNGNAWTGRGKCGFNSTGVFWLMHTDTDITTAPQLNTWLSTHNTIVYYAIETPTDTKIIDSTLISQLDAVHQFLTRYGYNATVSGNLPIVIDKTAL